MAFTLYPGVGYLRGSGEYGIEIQGLSARDKAGVQ